MGRGLRNLINKLKNEDLLKSRLIHNIGYLGVLNILNIILPLLVYPYIIQRVGLDNYGKIVFAQSVYNFVVIFVNFGLNIFSLREISFYRNDIEKLSKIVSAVYSIKILLFIIGEIILLLLVYIIPVFYENKILIILTSFVAIGEVLFPVWYFQGIEKMKYITLISSCSKIVSFSLIFFVVRSESDIVLYPLLNFLGAIVSGILSIKILSDEGVRLKRISFLYMLKILKCSFPFFLSRFSAILVSQLNSILLGVTIGMREVAIYDIVKKITDVLRMPLSILYDSFFPKLVTRKDKKFLFDVMLLRLFYSIIALVFVVLLGKIAIRFFDPNLVLEAFPFLLLMSLIIPLVAISHHLGAILIINNNDSSFNKSVVWGSLLYMTICIVLFNHISLLLMVSLLLIIELLVVFYRFIMTKKIYYNEL